MPIESVDDRLDPVWRNCGRDAVRYARSFSLLQKIMAFSVGPEDEFSPQPLFRGVRVALHRVTEALLVSLRLLPEERAPRRLGTAPGPARVGRRGRSRRARACLGIAKAARVPLFWGDSKPRLRALLVSGRGELVRMDADWRDEAVEFSTKLDLRKRVCRGPLPKLAEQLGRFSAVPAFLLEVPAGGEEVPDRAVGWKTSGGLLVREALHAFYLPTEDLLLDCRVGVRLIAMCAWRCAMANGGELRPFDCSPGRGDESLEGLTLRA